MKGKPHKARKPGRVRVNKRVDTALDLLERGELVKPLSEADRAYLFKHGLVQDTAQATLLRGDYRRLHSRVANAYETLYASRGMDEFAAVLAQHYAEAEDDAKTLEYSTRAGDLAARVFANQEALMHYTRAIQVATRRNVSGAQLIHLYQARGRVLEVSARFHDALATYEDLGALAAARADRTLELAALVLQATARATPTTTFDVHAGKELATKGLELARQLRDRASEARLLWVLTLLNVHASDSAAAIAYGKEALAIAEELNAEGQDQRALLAYILHDLSTALLFGGESARGMEYHDRAGALWRELDNKPMLSDNLGVAMQVALAHGELEQALAYGAEGIAISKEIDNIFGVFFNGSVQALVYRELGEFAEALKISQEAMQPLRGNKSFNLAMVLADRAWMYASIGAFEQAQMFAAEARQSIPLPIAEYFRTRAYALLARLDVLNNDLAAAAQDLAESRRTEQFSQQTFVLGEIAFAEAELALAETNPERALAALDAVMPAVLKTEYRNYLPQIYLLRGRALILLGQRDAAREAFAKGYREAMAMNARRALWHILAAWSDLERARHNPAEAEALREEARAVLDYIVAHIPEEFRAGFLDLPQVRELRAEHV